MKQPVNVLHYHIKNIAYDLCDLIHVCTNLFGIYYEEVRNILFVVKVCTKVLCSVRVFVSFVISEINISYYSKHSPTFTKKLLNSSDIWFV